MIALLLDAGNSRLKWALAKRDEYLAEGVASYADLADVLAPLAQLPTATRVLACNVAGPAIAAQLSQQLAPLTIEWLKPTKRLAGVSNGYREPGQLGADRWAALIAVRGMAQGDAIVVMAGTAMTVDALSERGDFVGGVITPGFSLMREALAKGTADLGLPDGAVVPFAQSTGEAIVNGALVALVGAIQVQQQRLANLSGRGLPVVYLSGGDGPTLLPVLKPLLGDTVHTVDNLVLRGLARLAFTDRES